jgi:hypothetical protein
MPDRKYAGVDLPERAADEGFHVECAVDQSGVS